MVDTHSMDERAQHTKATAKEVVARISQQFLVKKCEVMREDVPKRIFHSFEISTSWPR